MNTERLYEFVVLSRTLNYSNAAKTLFISQSVLSKHVAEMEKELNVSLLKRTTHGVSLTPAGELLAHQAPEMLEKCNHATNLVQLNNAALEGIITIAAALEFTYASHLQIFIGRFMEQYPNIEIKLNFLSDGTPTDVLTAYDFLFTPCEYPILPEGSACKLLQEWFIFIPCL